MRPMFKLLFGLSPALLLAPALACSAELTPRIEPSAPRNFGYVMGDLIDYHVLITVPESYALETEYLPKPGALDEWLDLRTVSWTKTNAKDVAHYRLRLTYQVFKGVRQPEKLTIPSLPVRFQGQAPLEARTPPWDITIAPIIPPDIADEKVEIRESVVPEPLPILSHRLRLIAYLAGTLAVLPLLAWRYGKLPFFTKTAPPFARTMRDLKKLSRKPADADAYRTAIKLLHRALDDTAGFRLFAGELESFLADHPAFAELRDELNHFFALSRQVFFTAPDAPIPADSLFSRLEALCRQCVLAERRSV
jgi:mxaA protein